MSTITKSNGGFPSLVSDFFNRPSLFGRNLFDMDVELMPARLGVNMPSANITETPKEFKIELAAPGLERKDFNIELDNHTLRISAEKEEQKSETEGEYSRREYSFNSFSRSFTLPQNVKEESIDAKYTNGILQVIIPKLKEGPSKTAHKIQIS